MPANLTVFPVSRCCSLVMCTAMPSSPWRTVNRPHQPALTSPVTCRTRGVRRCAPWCWPAGNSGSPVTVRVHIPQVYRWITTGSTSCRSMPRASRRWSRRLMNSPRLSRCAWRARQSASNWYVIRSAVRRAHRKEPTRTSFADKQRPSSTLLIKHTRRRETILQERIALLCKRWVGRTQFQIAHGARVRGVPGGWRSVARARRTETLDRKGTGRRVETWQVLHDLRRSDRGLKKGGPKAV